MIPHIDLLWVRHPFLVQLIVINMAGPHDSKHGDLNLKAAFPLAESTSMQFPSEKGYGNGRYPSAMDVSV